MVMNDARLEVALESAGGVDARGRRRRGAGCRVSAHRRVARCGGKRAPFGGCGGGDCGWSAARRRGRRRRRGARGHKLDRLEGARPGYTRRQRRQALDHTGERRRRRSQTAATAAALRVARARAKSASLGACAFCQPPIVGRAPMRVALAFILAALRGRRSMTSAFDDARCEMRARLTIVASKQQKVGDKRDV